MVRGAAVAIGGGAADDGGGAADDGGGAKGAGGGAADDGGGAADDGGGAKGAGAPGARGGIGCAMGGAGGVIGVTDCAAGGADCVDGGGHCAADGSGGAATAEGAGGSARATDVAKTTALSAANAGRELDCLRMVRHFRNRVGKACPCTRLARRGAPGAAARVVPGFHGTTAAGSFVVSAAGSFLPLQVIDPIGLRRYPHRMHVAITGASSGIGEALARRYIARGTDVTLVARRGDRLREIATGAPARVHTVTADLSDVAHVTDWIESAVARLGPIDVLVNNAGASMIHPTPDTDWNAAEELFRLNVLAPLKLTCTLLPGMIARGSGCIVDIASVAALGAQPGFFVYGASKSALASASESLRLELRGTGVHVVTVYPGPVRTPMAQANFDVYPPSVARRTPTGDAAELARMIARAVERREPRVVYPGIYAIAGWLPRFLVQSIRLGGLTMERPRNVVAFEAKRT